MRHFRNIALAALTVAGASLVSIIPADARVAVGIGIGPGYYGPDPAYPGYYPYCDYYSYPCTDYYGPYPYVGWWGGWGGGWHGGYHGGHGVRGFHGHR